MQRETSATQSLRMFVNGDWVESASRETITSIDPANRQPVAEVPRGKGEDVDLAVEAARRAFESPEWSEMAPAERGRILSPGGEDSWTGRRIGPVRDAGFGQADCPGRG
jgi:delta 1-pyrroline-5-carboxylate dehydrogenase